MHEYKQIVLEINNVVDMIRLAWVDLWLINFVETGFNVLYYMASIRFDESCNLIGQFEVRILP